MLIPSVSGLQQTQNTFNINVVPSFLIENEPEILYINTESHYEYGFEVGKRYPILFSALKFLSNPMSSEEEQDIESYLDNLDQEFHDEISGLADSIEVTPLELIHLLNILCQYLPELNCTTSVTTGMATTDGTQTYLTQNIDNTPWDRPLAIWWILHPNITKKEENDCFRYLFFGIPICYEYRVVNEKMLGWGANGLNQEKPKSEFFEEGGSVTTYALERYSMENFEDFDDVLNYWSSADRESIYHVENIHDYTHLCAWCSCSVAGRQGELDRLYASRSR